MTDMRIITNHKSRVASRLDLVAAARERGVFGAIGFWHLMGKKESWAFFLESGDRGDLQLHITLTTRAFIISFYGGVGRAMGCMDGNGAELDSFFFCLRCPVVR